MVSERLSAKAATIAAAAWHRYCTETDGDDGVEIGTYSWLTADAPKMFKLVGRINASKKRVNERGLESQGGSENPLWRRK